jgi:hypothetical protein
LFVGLLIILLYRNFKIQDETTDTGWKNPESSVEYPVYIEAIEEILPTKPKVRLWSTEDMPKAFNFIKFMKFLRVALDSEDTLRDCRANRRSHNRRAARLTNELPLPGSSIPGSFHGQTRFHTRVPMPKRSRVNLLSAAALHEVPLPTLVPQEVGRFPKPLLSADP